uniref:Uncharacterized protein n=1 Tax=Parascaris univalens TaxID=6257 RepID=A0A915CFX4_PARUN
MQGTIIGIAGCTNAGKTTVARTILQKVDERRFVEAILNAAVTHDNVVVEGNMLTELPLVRSLISRILFLTLDRETCLVRRLQRSDYDPPDEP